MNYKVGVTCVPNEHEL